MHGAPANIRGHLAGVLPKLGTCHVGTHTRPLTAIHVDAPIPQNTPQQKARHQHKLGHSLCSCFCGVILHDEAATLHGLLSVHAHQPHRYYSEHKAAYSQPLRQTRIERHWPYGAIYHPADIVTDTGVTNRHGQNKHARRTAFISHRTNHPILAAVIERVITP